MADKELRNLERNYNQDPTDENLARLNARRLKAGLAILRDPKYVIDWTKDFYTTLVREPVPDDIAQEHEESDAEFGILIKNIIVRGHLHLTWTDDTPPVPSLEIQLEPFMPIFRLFSNFQLSITVLDLVIVVSKPRRAPEDWRMKTAYAEITHFPNVFENSTAFLEFVKKQYLLEVDSCWESILSSTIGRADAGQRREDVEMQKRAIASIIDAANAIQRADQLVTPCPLMQSILEAHWFQRSLEKYGDMIERTCRGKDLVFDSENSWISLVVENGKYVFKFEAGYNETIDRDNFDEYEPSGDRYGSVSDVVREVDGILSNISGENWEVEWEYEDPPEADSEDIAIILKGQMTLTTSVLLTIVNRF